MAISREIVRKQVPVAPALLDVEDSGKVLTKIVHSRPSMTFGGDWHVMLNVVPLGLSELFGKVFSYLLEYRSTTQRPDYIRVQMEIFAKYVPLQPRFWSKVSLLALLFLCTSRDMKGGLQFSE